MVMSVLDRVPDHIKTPEGLELKVSSIDTGCVGVFCACPVAEGTQFGPYVGKIVPAEAAKGIDRRYSWEVFDLDKMTLSHVVDATDPSEGNWMRYVNCARFFEEQNIVSIQVGQDVFYKAMKNIEPGEELLTWYKRKRGRKRKSTTDGQEVKINQEPDSNGADSPKLRSVTPRSKLVNSEVPIKSPEKPKRIRKPKIIPDTYQGSFLVPKKYRRADDDLFEPLKPGQLRRRRKKVAVESAADKASDKESPEKHEVDDEKESENEPSSIRESAETPSSVVDEELATLETKPKMRRGRKKSKVEMENGENLSENRKTAKKVKASSPAVSATSQLQEINSSVNWIYPEKGQEYIFILENHMITLGPNGCVYTCDICNGVYKNKFSLKRHYLRNHINYKYLSKADIINCLINLQQVIEAEEAYDLVVNKIKKEKDKKVDDRKERISKSIADTEHDNDITDNSNKKSDTDNTGFQVTKNDCDIVNENETDSSYNEEDSDQENSSLNTQTHTKDKKKETSGLCNQYSRMNDKDINNSAAEYNKESSVMNRDSTNLPETENISSNADRMTNHNMQSDSKQKVAMQKPEYKGVYRCFTCRQIFDTLVEIKEHTMSHSDKDSTNMPFRCEHCSMRFFFKQNLVRHSASHEGAVNVKKEPSSPGSPAVLKEDTIPTSHPCAICHERFESLDMLAKHQEKHKNDLAKKNCPCQYCGKDFLSVTNMKKHVRFHLGYRITCRYCPEVFSNVGALRKHTRVSHPEIYKAKQLDKIARHGVLRRPDKKYLDSKDESIEFQEELLEKVEKPIGRKDSKDKISLTEDSLKTESKEESEIKQEEFHFDHGISFAADEIDDGGSRFKFSCTVCKKRFSNYINMCRHRRKVHSNESSKPKTEEPVVRLNTKKQQTVSQTPEEVALFYASVSHNIATNLNDYIDGKLESLANFKDHISIEDYTPVSAENEKDIKPVDFTWEMYNFPPNFKPGKTISFTEIRNEFDIHSEFDSHCKAFESQSDTVDQTGYKGDEKNSYDSDSQLEDKDSKLSEILNDRQNTEGLRRKHILTANNRLVNSSEKSRNNTISDSALMTVSKQGDISKMDLTARKAQSLLRKEIAKSQFDGSSPCTEGFKHIEKGEYANFDDLLIGDIESPIIPRSQSVASCISSKRRDLKMGIIHKSDNALNELSYQQSKSAMNRVDGNSISSRNCSPKPLSLLCENLLGLKRKDTIGDSEILSSGSSSLSSLDSHSSGDKSGHNGSWLTTLSLAASQKENERFQSTNQIFRDIKADYSDAPNHSFDNYHDIAFGKNGQVACVCAVCKKHFNDFECLIRHHWKKHPASICQFIEIEQGHEIDSLHFSEPSTVGALAVTDPGLENVSDREIFNCTGCGASFKTLAKLHIHIVTCTPIYPAVNGNRQEKGSKTPIKKRIQKKIKTVLNGGNNFQLKIKNVVESDVEKDHEEPKAQNRLFSGFRKRTSMILPESPVKLLQRKNQDSVGYNPQNHVRRRELTELVDTHQCEACGLKFKTIILLERHVPNCSKKEKFKDLCPMKCPIIDESLAKLKHVCHYCQKHFTYMKSLVNHLQDFCSVKKQKVDKDTITNEDRVKENDIVKNFIKLEVEKSVKDTQKDFDIGTKKKGWQKGIKRKPKKKGHAWTVVKKKKPSNSEVNEEGIDSNSGCINEADTRLENDSLSSESIEKDYNTIHEETVSVHKQNDKENSCEHQSTEMENICGDTGMDDKIVTRLFNFSNDTETIKMDRKIADSIDEVDSGNDVQINEKQSLTSRMPVDTVSVKETETALSSDHSHFGEFLTSDEHVVQNGKIEVGKKVNNTDHYEESESNDLIKNTLTENENIRYVDQVDMESKIENTDDWINNPGELTLPKKGKVKPLLFQCIGTQMRIPDTDNNLSHVLDVEESVKDSGWKRFRQSFRKKIMRSKGKYEVNKDTTEQSVSRAPGNKLFQSFRKKQPKSLKSLFECPENVKLKEHCKVFAGSDQQSTVEDNQTTIKETLKETLSLGKEIVVKDVNQEKIQSSVCDGEEEKCKDIVAGDEVEDNLQICESKNSNISLNLTDATEIAKIADIDTGSKMTLNVGYVTTEKSLLPRTVESSQSSSSVSQDLIKGNELFTSNLDQCNQDLGRTEIGVHVKENCSKDSVHKKETDESDVQIQSYEENKSMCSEANISLNEENKHIVENIEGKLTLSDVVGSLIDNSNTETEVHASGCFAKNNMAVDNDILNKEKHINETFKECIDPNMLNKGDCNETTEIDQSFTENALLFNENTASLITESEVQSDKFQKLSEYQPQIIVKELEMDKQATMSLKEKNIKTAIQKSDTNKKVNGDMAIINDTAFESVPVYESVSEKVKKRQRNASNKQLFKSTQITGRKAFQESKLIPPDMSKKAKSKQFSGLSTEKINKLSFDASVSKKNTTKSRVFSKSKSASDMKITDKITSNSSKLQHVRSKSMRLSKDNHKKPKFKEENGSPTKTDKPCEIILSPSERVKMNKRQCKKETYNFGFPYMKNTYTNITKDIEKINLKPVNEGTKDNNLERTLLSDNTGTALSGHFIKNKKAISLAKDEIINTLERDVLKTDLKHNKQKLKPSRLPRKISKDSLTVRQNIGDEEVKLDTSKVKIELKAKLKAKPGRPKRKENVGALPGNPPSKIVKIDTEGSVNVATSEVLITKRHARTRSLKNIK